MAHSNASHPGVVELLFSAALERYQASWDRLIEAWFDRECFQAVNVELDEIRKLAASLPQLSADVVAVVMRHAQLLRALVRAAGAKHEAQVAALRHKHQAAVDSVRRAVAPAAAIQAAF